jgi:hypothetical protein
MEAGRQIDLRRGQFPKAFRSRIRSFDPDSKVTLDNAEQPKKQWESITSTALGMQIRSRDKQRTKADLPNRLSDDSDSNVTVDNIGHSKKQ